MRVHRSKTTWEELVAEGLCLPAMKGRPKNNFNKVVDKRLIGA